MPADNMLLIPSRCTYIFMSTCGGSHCYGCRARAGTAWGLEQVLVAVLSVKP